MFLMLLDFFYLQIYVFNIYASWTPRGECRHKNLVGWKRMHLNRESYRHTESLSASPLRPNNSGMVSNIV